MRQPSLHERYQAHRAVRELLERLAAPKPLVLVLDDVHWADAASIELLAALLRHPPQAPVLVALGVRPRQAPGPLSHAVAQASRTGALEGVEIGPLSEPEAGELVGTSVDSSVARALYAESGGNPFYLEQLARPARKSTRASASPERGSPRTEFALGGGAEVPTAVATSLAEELAVLSPGARRLLDAAAVVGDPFEPELAAEGALIPESDALVVLDELCRCDLIRRTELPRRFRFRHPLVRRAVYQAIQDGWRLSAHARVAQALAARGEQITVLAHHIEQSARRGDHEAIALLREAAAASAQRAPDSAAQWYRAALRLLPDEGTDEERIELLSALAGVLAGIGQYAESRASLLELLDLVPPDAGTSRIKLIAACAAVEHLLGRHEEAHERLVSALAHVADDASPEGAALRIDLAVDAYHVVDYEAMCACGLRALELARRRDDAPLTAAAAAVVSAAKSYLGLVQEAEAYRGEAAALVDGLADHELARRLDAAAHLATADVYLDHFEDAGRHSSRGLAVGRATGQGELFPFLTQIEGIAHFMLGRLDEAADVLDGGAEAARHMGNVHSLAWTLFNRSWVALLAGDLETALATAEESVRLFGGLQSRVVTLPTTLANTCLGTVLLEAGEPQRCLEIVLTAGGGPELPRIPGAWRVVLQEVVTRAWLALRRQTEAEQAADRAETRAAELGLPLALATAQRARAAVALAGGDPEAATEAALASATTAEGINARIDAARARALAGRALVAAGARPRGAEELEKAFAEFAACGAVRFRDEAARELRRLGRRFHQPRAAGVLRGHGLPSLSRRELEVAALVKDRKTNREIAAELFLSQKTVETHLHHIFQKLGVTSRTSVARAIEGAVAPSSRS